MAALRSTHVLFVAADADEAFTVRDGIERMAGDARSADGYRIVDVHDLAAALALLRQVATDMIVLGVDDAGHTGLRTLRDQHPDTPVIVLSERGDIDHATRAVDHGAAACLPKGRALPQRLLRTLRSLREQGGPRGFE